MANFFNNRWFADGVSENASCAKETAKVAVRLHELVSIIVGLPTVLAKMQVVRRKAMCYSVGRHGWRLGVRAG